MARPITSETRLREVEAYQLRKQGKSLEEIAQTLGYANSSGAHKAVARAAERALYVASDDDRRLQMGRIADMWANLYPKMEKGDLRAMEVAIKLMEREAKLLGLDAPEPTPPPVEVTVRFIGVSIDDL